MKSVADLIKLRDQTKVEVKLRDLSRNDYHVAVSMGTCGIAAGAKEVYRIIMEEVLLQDLPVQVKQTGCVGLCSEEPVVEVYDAKGNHTTYVKMDVKKANELVEHHLKQHHVLSAYTLNGK